MIKFLQILISDVTDIRVYVISDMRIIWDIKSGDRNMETNKVIFQTKPLREQVCEYLKGEIAEKRIKQGESINLRQLSQELKISITPLRDALLQLEGQGMVTILPRRGIILREFTLKDVQNYYDIMSVLECHALETAMDKLTESHVSIMRELNKKNREVAASGFYYECRPLNKAFHSVYLDLSQNNYISTLWNDLSSRLYYCPTNIVHTFEWEQICCDQHDDLVNALEQMDLEQACQCIKDSHWSYNKQKNYILRYYDLKEE